jgi:transcriptional regulator of met regulon
LKWYLESNSLRQDIMNFIHATTSLETLMSKFEQIYETQSAFLDKDTLNELCKTLKKSAKDFLKSKGINSPEIRQKVYSKLSEIKRPSYLDKAKKLLDY